MDASGVEALRALFGSIALTAGLGLIVLAVDVGMRRLSTRRAIDDLRRNNRLIR